MDLHDPRALLADSARTRAQRRHRPGLPGARPARGRPARARGVRRRARGVHGRRGRPRAHRDGRRATRPTSCATWSAPPTRTCAAAGSGGRALEPTVPPLPAGERERLEEAARVALAELGNGAATATVAGAIERLEAALDLLAKLDDDRLPDAGELKGLELKGRAKALSTEACEDYRTAYAEFRSFVLARLEQRDHTMLSGLLELYGERYERAKRERSGLDFEDLELVSRDLLAADDRPARGLRGALRARARRRVPGHEPAPERAARAAFAGQPLPSRGREPVDLPLPQRRRGRVSRPLERGAGRRAGREHHGELPRPRRAARRHRPRLRADLGRALRAAARGSRDPRASRRAWTRASSCSPSTGRRAAGMRSSTSPPSRSAPGCRRRRPGARPRRACSPSASTSSPATGPTQYGDVVMLFRATTAMGFFERALEERGIPVHVVGGRGYWPSSRCPTCATGCPRSRTRSTGWRSTRCSPRRSWACRSTRWRCSACMRGARAADPWWAVSEPDDGAARRAAGGGPAPAARRSSSASRPSGASPARSRSRR